MMDCAYCLDIVDIIPTLQWIMLSMQTFVKSCKLLWKLNTNQTPSLHNQRILDLRGSCRIIGAGADKQRLMHER